MALETVEVCPVCGSHNFKEYLTAKDHTTSGELFQIVECEACRLLATSPRPSRESIGRYYESNEYISHTGGSGSLMDKVYLLARKSAHQSKRKLIEQYQLKGAVLDYGCGTGEFLFHCYQHGWKAIGVEPSEIARQKITGKIQVYKDLNEVKTEPDIITLWHVLEHIHDPSEVLTKLRDLLKETGTLFIAVPNHESYDAAYYKNNWAAYDVPRHLWHFSKTNMKQILEKNGFKLVAIQPMKLDSYYVSLLSEKYKNPSAPFLLQAIKAIRTGLVSNLKAGHDNYSSLLYIARP